MTARESIKLYSDETQTKYIKNISVQTLTIIMDLPEGFILLETRSGAKLEVRNGSLYTENEPEIVKALEEDLCSSDPISVMAAESVCDLMEQYGVIAES